SAAFHSDAHSSLPVSGSWPLNPLALKTRTWSVPWSVAHCGELYDSVSCSPCFHSFFPVFASSATSTGPFTPGARKTFPLWTRGEREKPNTGFLTPASSSSEDLHTNLPVAASRHNRTPVAPRA